jgi:hypothetical protein
VRSHDSKHRGHRDRRINRVATLPQDIRARKRGQRMTGDDGGLSAHHVRPILGERWLRNADEH